MYTSDMDRLGTSGLPSAEVTEAKPPANPQRAGSANGWCTTLQQPAAAGVFGFMVAYIRRRRSKV